GAAGIRDQPRWYRAPPNGARHRTGASSAAPLQEASMNARDLCPALAAGAFVLVSLPAVAADAPADMAMVNPGAIKWGDPPPVLPKGAKIAVLKGDPSKPGPYVMRGMFPGNNKVAPH